MHRAGILNTHVPWLPNSGNSGGMVGAKRDESMLMGKVILAHEESFSLCDLKVHPDTLQVQQHERSATLEPRVMQVLVALAKADGKIVTRDELIDCCWDGRVVGEDAINRALSRVRHCASEFAGGCFTIETIPRVGYRLTTANTRTFEDQTIPDPPQGTRSNHGWSRRLILGGITGSAAMLATGAVMWWPSEAHEPLPAAMQMYLHGIENRGQASLQQSEQSVSYLREATRIDPDFAEAWGALAWGYRGLLAYGPRPDTARITDLCRSAAKRALEIDPNNADANAALLLLEPIYRHWAEIEVGCRRLLIWHPRHSILQYNLGLTFCETGRWRDAIPILAAVAEREQFWPLTNFQLVHALMGAGRIEEAEDLLEHASKRWPRRGDFWLAKHRMLITSNRSAEASAFASDLSKRPVGYDQLIDMQLIIASALDAASNDEKKSAISKLAAHIQEEPVNIVLGSLGVGMLGAVDTAFDMLEGFFFGRGPWATTRQDRPGTSFLFGITARPLRLHSRFAALTREIGLERYWASAKRAPDFRRYG